MNGYDAIIIGALYRYFDNKNALLGALRADGFRYLKKTLADVRETAVSPVEAVSEAMKAYLYFAITQPNNASAVSLILDSISSRLSAE